MPFKKGINNPSFGKINELSHSWKGGFPKCIICNKLLKNRKAKKCKSCANKENKRATGHISWLKGTKGLISSNSGSIKKGEHISPSTEFKKGIRISPKTEFKKGEHRSPKTEFTLDRLKQMVREGKFSIKPNKPETVIKNLLDILFPNEYKYVGNFKFWIENFNPDFININGQKKIIEYFGNYWHTIPKRIERDERRLETYSKYGYKTLIIKQEELKDINKIKNVLMEFDNDKI